jgi:hypothetical protein
MQQGLGFRHCDKDWRVFIVGEYVGLEEEIFILTGWFKRFMLTS